MQQKLLTLLFTLSSTYCLSATFNFKDNWDIQLSNPQISIYDLQNKKLNWIELDIDTDINTVDYLKKNNVNTVCYFSAGSAEKWRADFKSYPKSLLGKTYVGFSDERWVDIRNPLLKPILTNRIKECARKGFNAVDPDNLNEWQNKSGFPIKKTDQIIFNKWIANEIHKNGMSAILKNASEIANNLKYDFDAHLTESCMKDNFCDLTNPFINVNKPVYNIEYLDSNQTKVNICSYFQSQRINVILKSSTFNIDSYRDTCN